MSDSDSSSSSRARKLEYVRNLEEAVKRLSDEKLALQAKVAVLTNNVWQQTFKIEELEKMNSIESNK